MFKLIKKWYAYVSAKLNFSFDQNADPRIQLEQAIDEANNQHKRLREQATSVIANQRQAQIRLTAKSDEIDKLNANVRQALKMADEADNEADKQRYSDAATTIAEQLMIAEADVAQLQDQVRQATQAAEQSKAAVQQNSRQLQKRIAEKSKLVSQLDQAKMQEEMNSAMAQLTETIGNDVPTLAEVEEKIQARYAKANAAAELQGQTVQSSMMEIEAAANHSAANERLAAIRAEMKAIES